MHNNSVALYSVVDGCSQQLYTVTTPGHRTDVRWGGGRGEGGVREGGMCFKTAFFVPFQNTFLQL